MAHPRRDSKVLTDYKRGKWCAGCEVCGWKPPARRVLAVHHVIPVSCGGGDEFENLILLCPNHYALAHTIGTRRGMNYYGPTDKATLSAAIKEVELREKSTLIQKVVVAKARRVVNQIRSGKVGRHQVALEDARSRRAQAATIRRELARKVKLPDLLK
jgi:hypothetical protein